MSEEDGATEFVIGESAYDWDETDKLDDIKAEHQEAIQARATGYHHVFAQEPLGMKILAEWVGRFCTGGVPGPDASARQCAMRDGKQELVAEIIQQIQIATGERQ